MEVRKTTTSIPDPLAPWTEKQGDLYGLSYAKLISSQWFGERGFASDDCKFMTRRNYVRQKRLLVRGENDAQYYKDHMSKDDVSLQFMNIDWSNINWVEKFARIVSNGISDQNYKFEVLATDKIAALQKKEKQDYYLKYMKSKTLQQKSKELLGIDMTPDTFIPADEEEMNIFMEIKDRPKIEFIEEILVEYVLGVNDWDYLSPQYNKDITDVGLMVGRVFIDKQNGVSIAYQDPENYIHSRVSRNDFSDKFYEGAVDTVTIGDIKREWGADNVNDKILREIAKSYGARIKDNYTDYATNDMADVLSVQVDVLRFAFKTSKTFKYKKHLRKGETVKLSKRTDEYLAPERQDVGMASQTFDTWMEGNYILGTEHIYGYRECENVYDDTMNKAHSPFVTMAYDIYENRLRSFTDNIEAPAKQLQKITLKIQQLVSELTPDLKTIDIDTLAELDDGKGGVKKEVWETALGLMQAKGVIFKKRINMGEDGIKDTPALSATYSPQGSALTILLNVWAHYYNLIRENTGVNPARDGSMPANSLVGVNQMAELASNTVTANIVEASVLFKKKICELISSRIHNIWSYKDADKLRKIYEQVVGKQMYDHLEIMKDRHLHEFAFIFRMNATSKQLQDFKELLKLAVSRENLDPEVVFQANEMAKVNVKKATEYLHYKRRQMNKENAEREMAMSKQKSENDAMANQAAETAKLESYKAKKEIDLMFMTKEAEIEVTKTQWLNDVNKEKDQREFQEDVYLEKMKSMTKLNNENFKEESKNQRTRIQATQQSKILDQRKKESAPIDFEAEEDWFETEEGNNLGVNV